MITSIILSYAWYFIIPLLVLGAIAVYIYVPVIGHIMAIILVACASALAAYELGYADRGKLDQSASLKEEVITLQINLDLAKKEAQAQRDIADASATREIQAQASSDSANQEVKNYEAQLSASQQSGPISEVHKAVVYKTACSLSASDVASLRRIGTPARR